MTTAQHGREGAPVTAGSTARVAMAHGPAEPRHDGVSDYVTHLVGALRGRGVDVHAVPVVPGRGGWWTGVAHAARQVRALRPDVVHVQFAPSAYRFSALPGALPLLLPRDLPLVTTLHEYGWWRSLPAVPDRAWRLLERHRLWDRESGRLGPASAALVVTNPSHEAAVLRRTGVAPDTVPLAPNVEVHEPWPGVRTRVRARLGLRGGAFLLVFFGFVHPVKGVRYLLEALPDLRERRPELHLAVVGGFTSQALPDGQARAYRAELEALARRLRVTDAVTFTGHLPAPEVSQVLHAADAAALPFTAGVTTKSGALLAALAHGVPTAVTLPDAPDGDLRDGREVAVVPGRRDARPLAATLLRLLDDAPLRRRLAAAGRGLVARHTWPALAEAHEQLYDRVAGHRRG